MRDPCVELLSIPSQLLVVKVLRRPLEFTQYTSYEYTKQLVEAGIAPSRGRTGTALDNAMAESVISTIKTELTKRTTWKTRLQLALVVYIGWYNARRLHRALDGQTPLEVLDEYNQRQTAARETVAYT